MVGSASELVGEVWSIGHQTSRFHVFATAVHRRYPRGQCQSVDANQVGKYEWVGTDIKCVRLALEGVEGGRDVLRSPYFRCHDLKTERAGLCMNLLHIQHGSGGIDIEHDRQAAQIGHNLAQKFESLATKIPLLVRQSRDVAARSRKTGDQAGAGRVPGRREYDRNDRCGLLYRKGWNGSPRDNDIDLEPDEFGRDLGE